MTDRTRMPDDQFHDLAIAHLLGEIEASDEAAFRTELERRGTAGRALLRGLREALGEIALAAPPVEPPPSLRAFVLTSLEPRLAAPPTPRPERSLWWAAAAVLVILSLGLGVRVARLMDERDRLRAVVERLEERVATADSTAERLAALEENLDLVGAPRSAIHGLVGTQAMPQAGARVFVDPVTGRAILFAYDLPILSSNELYELWAIDANGARAAGVFRPDEQGRARLEISDRDLLRDVQALAVTVEPAPGVDQPTGEIVLASQS